MANDGQFKVKTKYIATRGVKEYRATIEKWVSENDCVLEVGCEWGTTSVLIYEKCKNLIATDISEKCLQKARKLHPEIRFEVLDVFDIKEAMKFDKKFNKVYIDVSGFSGYRSLLDVLSLLNMYAAVFELEAIIVKSGALKNLARNCVVFHG